MVKKGERYTGIVEKIEFPNKGIVYVEGEKVIVKNGLPGQQVCFAVNKKRGGKCEGRLLEVVKESELEREENRCPHFGICGGCVFQSIPYEEQLKIKEEQVRELLNRVCREYVFDGIKGSPAFEGYRGKMEFSFGDEYKGGPLALGMHRRGSFHDVVNVDHCRIVHEDFTKILTATREYFKEKGVGFHKKLTHEGYLRHLLVRRAAKTGEILVALVTSGQVEALTEMSGQAEMLSDMGAQARAFSELTGQGEMLTDIAVQRDSGQPLEAGERMVLAEKILLEGWKQCLLKLSLEGTYAGILHIRNDSLADIVQSDETEVLYGQDFFYEEVLGLRFKISPFSFFQTNSLGAEVLYSTAREYIGETKDKVVFDLYSGTGTIAQVLAPVAKKVVGVEIVEEAVKAAQENAAGNGLTNCEFIAGDVLKVVGELEDKPDLIVVDPPRDGIHPKALEQIIGFGVEKMVYISCKITSLVRDLEVLQERGYQVERVCAVDMFPSTGNVEVVCLLSKLYAKQNIEVELKMSEMDLTAVESKATYEVMYGNIQD